MRQSANPPWWWKPWLRVQLVTDPAETDSWCLKIEITESREWFVYRQGRRLKFREWREGHAPKAA